jgi:hypothetical protein
MNHETRHLYALGSLRVFFNEKNTVVEFPKTSCRLPIAKGPFDDFLNFWFIIGHSWFVIVEMTDKKNEIPC